MNLPQDPVILLSVINTKLRDFYPNLEELSKVENLSIEYIENKLNSINCFYDEDKNQFI